MRPSVINQRQTIIKKNKNNQWSKQARKTIR